jgi:pimeloyl-ACP methyl ester carboxylesterase
MPRSKRKKAERDCTLDWASGFTAWLPERIQPVRRVGYTLMDLAHRGLLDEGEVTAFAQDTGLSDFAWRLLWADLDDRPDSESIAETLCHAAGVLVFVHGWDGSGEIWEDLPAMAIARNPGLVALVPDVNGFGGSPFASDTPSPEQCNPPAIMRSIERWLALLSLRAGVSAPKRPFVFVGHSMGGAALFFLDEEQWNPNEVGRIAAAPALLLNDRDRQRFYKALGVGIQLSGINPLIDRVAEDLIAPRIIDALAGWGSERVRAEHQRIYRSTPEGVIARTFAAMGQLTANFHQESWPNFTVFLGHKDRLVGLMPTLDLLQEMKFGPSQVRIALGDHYFFSVGSRADLHVQNRTLLLEEILAMHARLSAPQAEG